MHSESITSQSGRIIGFDLARGIAIIGMVIVNFKTVMVPESDALLYQLLNLLSGKAAALFVTLAGVGITLMHDGAKRKNAPRQVQKVKRCLELAPIANQGFMNPAISRGRLRQMRQKGLSQNHNSLIFMTNPLQTCSKSANLV